MTPGQPAEGAVVAPHAWRAARFMVIVAHPDDADFGPAATASRWIDAGSVGRLVCCTSGDQGGEEQRQAAAVVGYDEVRFLHQPDGALANELPLRELLVREIREFRPDAVFTHDPEVLFYQGSGVNHTDHRAAGIAAVDAVYPAARNPMAFPSLARAGFAPHKVRRLYLFWPGAATAWVDVSAAIERKIDALRCHASQLSVDAAFEQRMRDWAAEEGGAIGVASAEAFRLVVIDDDEEPAEPIGAEPAE